MPSTLLSFITIAVYSCTLCQAPPPVNLNPLAGEGGIGLNFALGPGPFINGIGPEVRNVDLAPSQHFNNVAPRFPVEELPDYLAPSPSQTHRNYNYNRDKEDPADFRRSYTCESNEFQQYFSRAY
jgi:hypothetical protein